MPFVEIVHVTDNSVNCTQKQAFIKDIQSIFAEVLGTSKQALRIVFYNLDVENSSEGMDGPD